MPEEYERRLAEQYPELAAIRNRPADDDDARHSPDFASVFWFGAEFEFTKSQAACVKVLWESLQNRTPSVGQETILELAESNQSELRMVFRDHSAWGTMIVTSSKGRYKLQVPEGKKFPRAGKTHG
jgi:hypothetical protein